MKKGEIVELNNIFKELKDVGDTTFKYFIIKNIIVLEPYLKPLQEIEKSNKLVLKYFEKDRNELINKFGRKEKGLVYIDINDEINLEKYKEGLQIIIKNHKNDLDRFEELFKEYKVLLDEEIEEEIIFKTISIDKCPKEGINSTQLEFLLKHNIIT
jgi:hypothetical protein